MHTFHCSAALLALWMAFQVSAQHQLKTVSVQLAGNRSESDAAQGKTDLGKNTLQRCPVRLRSQRFRLTVRVAGQFGPSCWADIIANPFMSMCGACF